MLSGVSRAIALSAIVPSCDRYRAISLGKASVGVGPTARVGGQWVQLFCTGGRVPAIGYRDALMLIDCAAIHLGCIGKGMA